MTTVIKKDGRKTPFYIEKIMSNLENAERVFGVAFKEKKEVILEKINSKITQYDEIESSKIFEIIEKELKEEHLCYWHSKSLNEQSKLDWIKQLIYFVRWTDFMIKIRKS